MGAGKSSAPCGAVCVAVCSACTHTFGELHAQPCCCLDLDTPNRQQPSIRLGEDESPRPRSPADSITSNGRSWKQDHVNISAPHMLTFVLMEEQLIFFPTASTTKQTQGPERPHTIHTFTSNFISFQQGRAVSQLSSQMVICPTSFFFFLLLLF